MNKTNTTLELPDGSKVVVHGKVIDARENFQPTEMFHAIDWLGEHRDIYDHVIIPDRHIEQYYSLAELMADFANWYYTMNQTKNENMSIILEFPEGIKGDRKRINDN